MVAKEKYVFVSYYRLLSASSLSPNSEMSLLD
jgi:hypothetical protein